MTTPLFSLPTIKGFKYNGVDLTVSDSSLIIELSKRRVRHIHWTAFGMPRLLPPGAYLGAVDDSEV